MKDSLKGWGVDIRGNSIKLKKELVAELEQLEQFEEIQVLSPSRCEKKGHIQSQLMKIYEEEEMFWRSRTSEKWLLQGDSNTAFFHRVANGRKRKNTMYTLQDGENQIEGTENLLQHATSFYKNLFGQGEGNLISFAADSWLESEKLTDIDNSCLDAPFLEKEVKMQLI